MTTQESYSTQVRFPASLHRERGRAHNFHTFSSADIDLGESANSFYHTEPHMGVSSLDPIGKAVGNFLLVVGAIALVCSVAVSIPLAVFLMFFAQF